MFLTEWDQDKVLAQERRESVKLTTMKVNERVARDMLMENLPLSLIAEISQLPEENIRNIAKTPGVNVL